MKNKLNAISGFIFCTLMAGASLASDNFSKYPAEIYTGKISSIDYTSSPDAKTYKTKISQSLKNGVNFAGKYIIVSFGCGGGCLYSLLVNAQTGKVSDFPIGGENYPMLNLSYKKSSTLLLSSHQEDGDCVRSAYKLQEANSPTLTLIKKTKSSGSCE